MINNNRILVYVIKDIITLYSLCWSPPLHKSFFKFQGFSCLTKASPLNPYAYTQETRKQASGELSQLKKNY